MASYYTVAPFRTRDGHETYAVFDGDGRNLGAWNYRKGFHASQGSSFENASRFADELRNGSIRSGYDATVEVLHEGETAKRKRRIMKSEYHGRLSFYRIHEDGRRELVTIQVPNAIMQASNLRSYAVAEALKTDSK